MHIVKKPSQTNGYLPFSFGDPDETIRTLTRTAAWRFSLYFIIIILFFPHAEQADSGDIRCITRARIMYGERAKKNGRKTKK